MSEEKFLVTGATGCIGSWVLRNLTDRGANFVATDISEERARPSLLLSDEELAATRWLKLDVTDTNAVDSAIKENAITRIVHLAGLQIPFARANPPLGAAVNVGGTVNILEAARKNDVKGVSLASSAAVYGPATKYEGRLMDDAPRLPDTLYGIYKVADEEMARVYWQDWQVPSVGLRPGVVYGVGRDQGLTSDISKAMLAVAAGKPFHIRFDGVVTLQHAGDVANMFIDCALADVGGARLCNIRNDVIEVSEIVRMFEKLYPDMQITLEEGAPLPFPADYDDSNLQSVLGTVPHTPLEEAIRRDVEMFKQLLEQGKVDLGQLEV